MRGYGTTASVTALLVLTLAACGGAARDGAGGTSPRPSVSAASSGTPSAGTDRADGPASPAQLLRLHEATHGVGGYSTCGTASWDDAGCGRELAAAGRVAEAMAEYVEEHFPDGEREKVEKAAKRVTKSVNTTRRLGCYGMGRESPRTDTAVLEELCPTLGRAANLAWLGFRSTVTIS